MTAPQAPPMPSVVQEMRRKHKTQKKRAAAHADAVLTETASRPVLESAPARGNSELMRIRTELAQLRDQSAEVVARRRNSGSALTAARNDSDLELMASMLSNATRLCQELLDVQRTLQLAWMAALQQRPMQDLAALLHSPDDPPAAGGAQ